MGRLFKVLVADNNTAAFDRLKKLPVWEENGFEIIGRTADMRSAAQRCKTDSIELLICYNRPPAISAEVLITSTAELSERTVCLAISPHDDSENMRRCFILGVIDYLTEPVGEQRLSEALARAAQRIRSLSVSSEYMQALEEHLADVRADDKKFVEKLREFLQSCENTTASTEYAADFFGFNKDYFGRLFKSKIGMTFGDFYKIFRIRYAERLLMSGKYKVYEVSSMLGFSSVDYFTTVFKKLKGKTPSEVKKL